MVELSSVLNHWLSGPVNFSTVVVDEHLTITTDVRRSRQTSGWQTFPANIPKFGNYRYVVLMALINGMFAVFQLKRIQPSYLIQYKSTHSANISLHAPTASYDEEKTVVFVQDVTKWLRVDPATVFNKCPVSTCRGFFNSSHIGNYDAVIIHGAGQPVPPEVLSTSSRDPDQRFILMGWESAGYKHNKVVPKRSQHDASGKAGKPDVYDGFFNWTMSFISSSDVYAPYGWFHEIGKPIDRHPYKYDPQWIPYDEEAFMSSLENRSEEFHALASRPHDLAWMASNCKSLSHREAFVNELKKELDVGTFGLCGEQKARCNGACATNIRKNYKFYFAAENSLCNDYVTEKFFLNMENHVVVAFGQADYSRIAPPHSFINARDFESPHRLANYLANMTEAEYLSYFWWKDHYMVVNGGIQWSFCELCAMLHEDRPPQTYSHLQAWWQRQQQCTP